MNSTFYFDPKKYYGNWYVVFTIKGEKKRLVRMFSSPYLARQFENKVKHSKKCFLISTSFT